MYLLWVELFPSKKYVDFLTANTRNCGLIWEQKLCKCNEVHEVISVGSTPTQLVPLQAEDRHARRRWPSDSRGRNWSDVAASEGVPRTNSLHQKPGGKKGSAQNLRESMTLLTPEFQTFSLQDCERVSFCCF